MDSDLAGFLHDDGVYLMSGQMLAQAQGFILPNLADHPAQIKYPVLYPALLSAGWKLQPHFPQNLPLLHWLTSLFGILALPLLYLYLRQVKALDWFASGMITVLTASSFFYIFYATSIMSEAPYFFLSLLTVYVAEKWLPNLHQRKNPLGKMIVLILLSTLVFHTRTVGIALIGGISLWFLLQKQWKNGCLYLAGSLCLTIMPWFFWVTSHAPQVTDINYPLAFLYGGYGVEFGVHAPSRFFHYLEAVFTQGFYPLMESALQMLFPMVSHLWGALWNQPALLMLSVYLVSGLLLLQPIAAVRHRQWSVSGLYIGCYVILVALWLYPNQAARFLTVILPWLWLSALKTGTGFKDATCPKKLLITRICLLVSLGTLTIWPAIQGYQLLKNMRTHHQITPSAGYASLAADYQETFAYIQKNIPKNATIASIWDPVFYLYTDRKTFPLFSAALKPNPAGQMDPSSFSRLRKSLAYYAVDYVVDEPYLLGQQVVGTRNPVVRGLRYFDPHSFKLLYETRSGKIRLYHLKQAQH